MTQRDSGDLQGELARLLAKSRQLRDRSGALDDEIQRLTRIIAGTADGKDAATSAEAQVDPGVVSSRAQFMPDRCDDVGIGDVETGPRPIGNPRRAGDTEA